MTGGTKTLALAAVAVPMAVALAVTMLVGMHDTAAPCTTGEQPLAAPTATGPPDADSIPGNYLALYQAAGRAYAIDWTLLAGIGKLESDHGRSRLPGVTSGANYAGARGPMQFQQPTWDVYGVDGNGDRVADVYNPADAIAGAANYLRAGGAPADVRGALWHYNHSATYANQVLAWAARYATDVTATESGAACTPPVSLPTGPYGTTIVAAAMRWLGTDYLWGGGDTQGPTSGCAHGFCGRGFDCSGLTLYAVYQATRGKVALPHYAAAQYHDPRLTPVDRDQLRPGDLVFFHNLKHVGIYVGGGKMINAPQTLDHVRIAGIGPGTSYRTSFVGARRLTTTNRPKGK